MPSVQSFAHMRSHVTPLTCFILGSKFTLLGMKKPLDPMFVLTMQQSKRRQTNVVLKIPNFNFIYSQLCCKIMYTSSCKTLDTFAWLKMLLFFVLLFQTLGIAMQALARH
jgi:hypothetical protein